MYQAQSVEQALAILLAVLIDSSPMTAWDYDARLAENFQCTFKELVSRFAATSIASGQDQLLSKLEKAAKDRNELAHHYFWNKASQFSNTLGRIRMVEELSDMANRLECLDRALSELACESVQKRGLTKEMLDEITETEVRKLVAGTAEPIRPKRVPKTVGISCAYEWRKGTVLRCPLVFASREGKFLILGENGLCFGPQDIPPEELVAKKDFSRALPASVNPRPKTSVPWNYGIRFANGYILRVSQAVVNGKVGCRFGLRETKR